MNNSQINSETSERRERIRKRILENAEKRVLTILSGPDGSETRAAPAFDGFTEEEEFVLILIKKKISFLALQF